jgi:hypothetical protein
VAVSSRLCRKVTKKVEKNNGFWRINANRSKIKEKLYYSLALYPNLGKASPESEKNNGFWRINANRSKIKEKLYYSLALYPNLGKASPESGARDSALRKSSPKESYKILKITPTF